jgi:hypothetical protein
VDDTEVSPASLREAQPMHEVESSRRLPLDLRPLATAQDLVVTRRQLADLGLGHEVVKFRTGGGVWSDLGPRVVVLHTGELTRRQRAWVGLLHAGPGAALALATAAEAGGLRGYLEWTVHVAVPHGREVGHLDHPKVRVRLHQTRHASSDLAPGRSPARHNLPRAVVEMASAMPSDNRTRAVIAAAVQQRLLGPGHLSQVVEARPTLPKRLLIRETIADVAGGAHSLPELDYARALRRAGLPEPTRQRKVCRPNGVWYLDNDFDDWLVTVEVNGMQHHDLLASEFDDVRRGGLQRRGRLVVDISSYTVRRRERVAVLRTAEALMSRGWVPSPSVRTRLHRYAREENWPLEAA